MSGVRSFTVWRFVEKRRENSVFRVCMVFSWIYYGLGLTVKGFSGDVCRVLGFVCHLARDFRILCSQYRIFSVFR